VQKLRKSLINQYLQLGWIRRQRASADVASLRYPQNKPPPKFRRGLSEVCGQLAVL
jgi:hypothetical protein